MDPREDPLWQEDCELVKRSYREVFGCELDLRNPRTFNEKVSYKILFDRRPLLTRITDKITARDYVAERAGPAYLTRLYQQCAKPRQIDWQSLPVGFVIKANHGSDMNVIVRDKATVELERLVPRLNYWLGVNYYYACRREWAYRDIVPALLVEELLSDAQGQLPSDFKLWVFNGRVKYLQMTFGRYVDHRSNYYDRALRRIRVRQHYPAYEGPIAFPPNLEEMFALAERLAEGLDFVRVDLYNLNGRIIFGELTSYPDEGLGVFHPPEFDAIFGAEWKLPASY